MSCLTLKPIQLLSWGIPYKSQFYLFIYPPSVFPVAFSYFGDVCFPGYGMSHRFLDWEQVTDTIHGVSTDSQPNFLFSNSPCYFFLFDPTHFLSFTPISLSVKCLFFFILLKSARPPFSGKANMPVCLWISVKQGHANTGSLCAGLIWSFKSTKEKYLTFIMVFVAITLT